MQALSINFREEFQRDQFIREFEIKRSKFLAHVPRFSESLDLLAFNAGFASYQDYVLQNNLYRQLVC